MRAAVLAIALAACGGEHALASQAGERPGLGTSFGEAVYAPVHHESFERASPDPWAELALYYDDARGVAAHAAFLGERLAPLDVATGDGAIAVALVDEAGRTLPGARAGDRTLVVGEAGARYRIVVHDATPARFEIVASVDGLDVIDGRPADPVRRGYIVEPHDTLVIDGFRTSDQGVAAFRFGTVADSYAARTAGDRDVGVVGIAIFAERGAAWRDDEMELRDTANPFPARGYAQPPQ
ncbi:MAG TPA: hypothetical protein VMJ10_25605 [Kofleriaceae bacterium]|nr:hypothetical protein [Kofleriaceae bacterium]